MEQTTKSANAVRQKQYRERHPERIKEQERQRNQKRAGYQRQWREDNSAAHKAQRKEYRERNIETIRAKDREYNYSRRVRERLEVLAALGGKCVRCSIDDWRVLQIDHIDGGGTQERRQSKSIARYYTDMLLSPEKYQILCANCHQLKRYEEHEGRKRR